MVPPPEAPAAVRTTVGRARTGRSESEPATGGPSLFHDPAHEGEQGEGVSLQMAPVQRRTHPPPTIADKEPARRIVAACG